MSYESVKKWRNKSKKNKSYNADFMRAQRKYYKTMWIGGKIEYEKIPFSYRPSRKNKA